MVIIYNATQEIPSSLSEFYEALFHTLLTRHDRTKPGFRRKRSTALSDSELKRLFEAFCYAARQRDQLALTESAAGELLVSASGITGIACKAEPFLNDITKVACLMQQEGFDYHFLHKSVAEFHAASFISHTSEENARKFYDGVRDQKWQKWRQELEFLAQIDRVRYLRYLFVPSATQAFAEFGIDTNDTDISRGQVLNVMNRMEALTSPVAQGPSGGFCSLDVGISYPSAFTVASAVT